jgi:hypothetical protein
MVQDIENLVVTQLAKKYPALYTDITKINVSGCQIFDKEVLKEFQHLRDNKEIWIGENGCKRSLQEPYRYNTEEET